MSRAVARGPLVVSFLVRRVRGGGFLATGADWMTETTLVAGATLHELHKNLAQRVALQFGRQARIRFLVGYPQPVAGVKQQHGHVRTDNPYQADARGHRG
jgi:hypothetical protein